MVRPKISPARIKIMIGAYIGIGLISAGTHLLTAIFKKDPSEADRKNEKIKTEKET